MNAEMNTDMNTEKEGNPSKKEDSRLKFLMNLSYELRTPVDAIMELTALAGRGNLPRPTREHLKRIDAAAHYVSSIIDDVLDISLFESGKLTLKSEEFRFGEMIDQVNDIVFAKCRKAEILYSCRVSPKVRSVYVGDEGRIKQILLNILDRAVADTPHGGEIVLDARETRSGRNTAELTFAVIDNGEGIDEKELPHLFDAFYVKDEDTGTSGGLSTLGLSIASDLVELMGGAIHVDTKKHVGTRFTIEISAGLPGEARDPEKEDAGSALDIDFQNRRILLVEDNQINAEITQDLLEMHGFRVEHAVNGEEAVTLFEDSAPGFYDAILMDVRMPVKNGIDAVKEIRALERSDAREVPIIAMSANAYVEDIEKSLEAGMDVHLSKPVDQEKLFSVLAEYLLS